MACINISAHGLAPRRAAGRFKVHAIAAALALACFVAAAPAHAAISASGDILPSVEDPEFPGVFVLDYNETTGIANGDPVIIGGTGQSINGTDLGTLFIDAPAFTPDFTSTRGIIGDEQQGSGFVTISQAGSRWGIMTSLIVGDAGFGSLDLVNGGALTGEPNDLQLPALDVTIGAQTTGQGIVTVRQAGSLLRSNTLTVGVIGTAQLAVTLGAQVETTTTAIIGQSALAGDLGAGLVTVDGSGSRWLIGRFPPPNATGSTGNLIVGGAGRGTLNITNRGVVRVTDATNSNGNVVIGATGSATAGALGEIVVDGVFSQLRAYGTITISQSNNARGVLRVRNGGEVRANKAITLGNDGVLEISGGTVLTPVGINNGGTIQTVPGSLGQIDSIVTNLATGEIRTAGTLDRVREKLIFTRPVSNAGLITSIGGEMEFTSMVTNTGLIAGRDAIYRFRDPFTNAGSLAFSVGVSDVYGTIINNGVIGAATKTEVTFYDPVTNNGTLTVLPGGAMIFLDTLTLGATSAVSLQLNAVASVEQIGQLQILGAATLDGALNLTTFSGLDPEAGDSFQIISGSSITGLFDLVNFPPAPGNNWSLQYTPNAVFLNYVAAPAFDADIVNDGIVNGADLAVIQANFGLSPATQAQGDVNGDGRVDGDDFLIWQQRVGQPSAVPNIGAVPEPGSVVLALSGLALVAGLRRRSAPCRPNAA